MRRDQLLGAVTWTVNHLLTPPPGNSTPGRQSGAHLCHRCKSCLTALLDLPSPGKAPEESAEGALDRAQALQTMHSIFHLLCVRFLHLETDEPFLAQGLTRRRPRAESGPGEALPALLSSSSSKRHAQQHRLSHALREREATQSHTGQANSRASHLVKAQERNGLGRELVSQALGDFRTSDS